MDWHEGRREEEKGCSTSLGTPRLGDAAGLSSTRFLKGPPSQHLEVGEIEEAVTGGEQ